MYQAANHQTPSSPDVKVAPANQADASQHPGTAVQYQAGGQAHPSIYQPGYQQIPYQGYQPGYQQIPYQGYQPGYHPQSPYNQHPAYNMPQFMAPMMSATPASCCSLKCITIFDALLSMIPLLLLVIVSSNSGTTSSSQSGTTTTVTRGSPGAGPYIFWILYFSFHVGAVYCAFSDKTSGKLNYLSCYQCFRWLLTIVLILFNLFLYLICALAIIASEQELPMFGKVEKSARAGI